MASLQITIEIEAAPIAGHALNQLKSEYGDATAAVADRIGRANAATFPSFEYDPVKLLVRSIAAAVIAAEI